MNTAICRIDGFTFEVRKGKPYLNGMEITANRVTMKVTDPLILLMITVVFGCGIWLGLAIQITRFFECG